MTLSINLNSPWCIFFILACIAILLGVSWLWCLKKNREMLQRLDRENSEFISIVGHQLRTPLTIIKGFLSLIAEGTYGKVNKETADALAKILISTEDMGKLIEDLLNASRVELGKMEFTMEKLDITKFLEKIKEDFSLLAKNKRLSLKLILPKKATPFVVADVIKMTEVISNLVENAVKYTKKGGITLSAEVRSSMAVINKNGHNVKGSNTAKQSVVRICVSDTGIGIRHEDIPHLFKKFSRGKDLGQWSISGTGLGLYVGKGIIEAHGGNIWVESQGENKGAKFIIELPIAS